MNSRFVIFCVLLKVFTFVGSDETSSKIGNGNCIAEDYGKSVESARRTEVDEDCVDDVDRDVLRKIDDSKLILDDRKFVEERFEVLGSLWPNVPLLPVVYATSSSMPEGRCKRQARRYLENLKNETLWAMQMFDASTKYPGGMISGLTRHLGDFDLCYNLKVELPSIDDDTDPMAVDEIIGRYCLVEITYEKQGLPPVNVTEIHRLEYDPRGSLWEAIREKGDSRRVKRYKLEMALCVPDVCTPGDIEAALIEPMTRAGLEHNVKFDVTVEQRFSQSQNDVREFTFAAKIYCCLMVVLISIVVMSTLYDFSLEDSTEKNDGSPISDLALCFSARRNYNSLMEITTSYGGLEIIHMVRFAYMCLVVSGHRIMELFGAPVVNLSHMESLYKNRSTLLVLVGTQLVEGFFSIGGLLVAYHLLEQLDKTKKLNFFPSVMIRFLRLTPTYALVVFFHMFVLPHIGSGPYWEWKVGLERDCCSDNWWTNLLYINNYVNPKKMCMFQTWYVSVDFQLFVLALLVIYVFWRIPRKIGYPLLCLIIIGGCVIPFVNTYSYGVQPVWQGFLQYRELRDVNYYTEHYVKTHERITSYFIGVLAGAVMYDHKRNPWYLNKVVSQTLFFLLAGMLGLASVFLAEKYYDPNEYHNGLDGALYACLHRGAWAVSCCALIVLPTVGRGLESHYNFLTPKWVQPFARLTYTAYLVHSVPQLYSLGATRIARQFSYFSSFWGCIPDVVSTFFVSFLISLVVEGPFRRIEKRFIFNGKKRKISNGMNTDTEKKD